MRKYTTLFLKLVMLFFMALPLFSFAGNVDKNVVFMSQNRALSFYIPNTYNPANPYKLMVSLHGAGGSSTSFRTGITPVSTDPSSPLYNCIIVCPDGGSDASKSFQAPAGDEEIIRIARDSAMVWYNIDTNHIYLQGFSLGGRSALFYGLRNYSLWTGLFLWTPAVQSIDEADNKSYFRFDYSNANKIPICMVVGGADVQYVTIVTHTYNILVDSNAIIQFKVMPGIGHTFPPAADAYGCVDFVDDFYTNMPSLDAGISKISAPKVYSCNTTITPTIRLMNRGSTSLTSVNINYKIGTGAVSTYTWTGTMPSLNSQNVTLPSISTTVGTHALSVYTSSPNNGADANTTNDAVMDSVKVITQGLPLPQSEGFEPAGSVIFEAVNNPDGIYSWYLSPSNVAKTGIYSAYVPNFIYSVSQNAKDELITFPLDLTSSANPSMTFDLAYVSRNLGSSDTLEILISTDCGVSYTTIYKKFGTALSTTTPTFKATQFYPTSTQWRTETISLSPYAASTKAFIKVRNITKYQNNLYIDNVNVSGTTVSAGVTISQTSGTNPICSGQSATFSASAINGGTSPSYQWKVNAGNVGTNSSTYTTTTLTNGQTVTCEMTSNLVGVTGSPATSSAITMTVNAIPSTPTISQNGTLLTSSSASGNQWYFNGSPISGAVNQTYTATQGGSYTVVVTISGCSSASSLAATVTFTAGVTITQTSGTNPLCTGQSATFSASPTNGGSSPSYQWKVSGGNVGSNSTTYTTTTLTNGQTVTCEMTSNLVGVTGSPATSNVITMTVSVPSTPVISQNDTLLTSSSATGNQWYYNGSLIPGATAQTYVAIQSGSYTVIVTLNGCSSSPSSAVSVVVTTITAGVTIVQTTGGNPTCTGESVTFSASPINGGTSPSYQWKVNGGNVGTNSSTYTTTALANGEAVTCVMTSNVSGALGNPATSNSITMIVNAVPSTPSISQSGTSLTSSSATGNQWYFNGSPISGAVSQQYTATQNGSYTVVVTANGCSSIASLLATVTGVGIEETGDANSFTVYPNPGNGEFTLSFNVFNKSDYTLEIQNQLGQSVYVEALNNFNGTYTKQLSISAHGKGIYVISLSGDSNRSVKKIIVY